MAKVSLTGNTYPVKEALKAIGATWDRGNKCWMIDEGSKKNAEEIIQSVPAPEVKTCWECGCGFTYAECKKFDGDWYDYYCGC